MARNISESSDTFYYDVACRTDEILFERLVGKMPSRKELDQMYTLSDGFKERMQKLIAAFDRRRTVPKAIRRIIVIAAIIAALVFGAMNAGAIYERLYNLFMVYMGNHSVAMFSEDEHNNSVIQGNVDVFYAPSIVPNGYKETQRNVTDIGLEIYYSNGVSDIKFSQFNMNSVIQMDSENTAEKLVTEHDLRGYYIYKNNTIYLIWEKGGYFFSLEGIISPDEAICIAKSLKEIS